MWVLGLKGVRETPRRISKHNYSSFEVGGRGPEDDNSMNLQEDAKYEENNSHKITNQEEPVDDTCSKLSFFLYSVLILFLQHSFCHHGDAARFSGKTSTNARPGVTVAHGYNVISLV